MIRGVLDGVLGVYLGGGVVGGVIGGVTKSFASGVILGIDSADWMGRCWGQKYLAEVCVCDRVALS